MRRATRAAWSAAYYLLAITPLRAAVTVQLESGFWTDESASANSGYDIPVSGSLEARGRIYNNRIRYLGEVRAGSKDYFRDEKVAIVREGYFEAPLWGGDVSIGRLLLSWGRADQVNPTDSLVTRDYQWRTVTDEEQKTGNDGISWSIDRADWRYTMIWLPNLRSSAIPWRLMIAQKDSRARAKKTAFSQSVSSASKSRARAPVPDSFIQFGRGRRPRRRAGSRARWCGSAPRS